MVGKKKKFEVRRSGSLLLRFSEKSFFFVSGERVGSGAVVLMRGEGGVNRERMEEEKVEGHP